MQQNIRMLPPGNGLFLPSPLKILCVLVFHLLLTHSCRGQSQLIGPSQPIVAKVGDDVILPCHLEPAVDVVAMTLEWKRPDPNPMFVLVRRAGQDLVLTKHPSYKDRTSVSVDELKHGNISLKLSKVKPSDNGTYQCYIPKLNKISSVELVVASGAVTSPVMTLAGTDRDRGGVVLQCESRGWHPEPEVLWLDSEGHVLSAGPTETVRGPDGLYTVSSTVTVEKRHRNNFTCRVQQKKINQTRETDFYIPDDFFKFQSSSSTVTVGFAVSLAVCILVILLLVFLLWRQNRIKTKKGNRNENECKSQRIPLNSAGKTKKKSKNQLQEEQQREEQRREHQQRKEETENIVKLLEEELKTKKTEVEPEQAELQTLREEKQEIETKLQNLKEELENKNKELVRILTTPLQSTMPWARRDEEQQRKKAEREAQMEMETLKKKLENQRSGLDNKIQEFEEKQAEVQPLQDEIETMETDLETLMEELINIELESIQAAPSQPSSSLWPIISRHKFQDEQWRSEKADRQVVLLEQKLQMKTNRVDKLLADVKKLKEVVSENEQKQLQKELETKKQEILDEQQKTKTAEEDLTQLNKLFQDEKTEREKAEEEVKTLKKELEAKEKLQEQDASSTTVPVIEVQVDHTKKRVYLINTSKEDQYLEGWKFQMQVNDREPSIDIFKESCKFSRWSSVHWNLPVVDSRDKLSWGRGDKLHISLFSDTGKIQHLSVHTYK